MRAVAIRYSCANDSISFASLTKNNPLEFSLMLVNCLSSLLDTDYA